jgi:hypothetical protein
VLRPEAGCADACLTAMPVEAGGAPPLAAPVEIGGDLRVDERRASGASMHGGAVAVRA